MAAPQAVIIGAGPAGMAAAIQLGRMGVDCAVIERRRPGGMLWNAQRVENYPGFPEGISGAGLAELFRRQFERWHGGWRCGEVTALDWRDGGFRIASETGRFTAPFAIVASGTRAKITEDIVVSPGAAEFVHRDVAELDVVTGREVLVVGGGDAAYDFALTLADANRVTLLQRRSASRALLLLQRRVQAHPRIRRLCPAQVRAIDVIPGGRVAVTVEGEGVETPMIADHVLLSLGREPALGFLEPALLEQRARLLRSGRLCLVGDVRGGRDRQVAIAVGDGVRAALTVAARVRGA